MASGRSDGSSPPERLTPRSAFYDKMSWSPDGRRLLAVRGSRTNRMKTLEDFGSHGATAELEIIWLPASGGEVHPVSWLGSGSTEQGRNVPHFGPDSTRLYVWAGDDGLVSMRFDGTDRKAVVKVAGLPIPQAPGTPAPLVEELREQVDLLNEQYLRERDLLNAERDSKIEAVRRAASK